MRYMQGGLTRQMMNMVLSIVMLAVTVPSLPMKAYANTNTIEAITGYYQKHLNRLPDELGLNYWVGQVIKHGKKLAEIEQAIQNSDEAKIRGFYLKWLNREPDQQGLNHWLYQVNNKIMTLASVEHAIQNSPEKISRELVYVPAGNISQVPLGTGNHLTNVNINMPNFWIGKTEVTGALWKEVYDWAVTKGYKFVNQGDNRSTMLPVTSVSWHDVVVWTNAYSEKDKLLPVYRDTNGNVLKDARAQNVLDNVVQSNNNGYRLPTGIEWEMAARWLGTTAPTTGSLKNARIATTGKDGKTYYWTPGNYASGATENADNAAETGAVAWYKANSGGTAKQVGGKRANALGMFDVSGNVWEFQFTSTWSTNRGIRGGSSWSVGGWEDDGGGMRISSVYNTAPSKVSTRLGFRLVRTAL